MVNIQGVPYSNPNVFAEGEVVSTGVAIPANNRVLCIVGEGARREVIVNFAAGGGQDGWNPTYTSTTRGTDGRHFTVSHYPLQSNRLVLNLNGIPLTGIEQTISTTTTFSYLYDYRVDISLGRIEMQTAHLVDQGGAYYTAFGANVGNGTITSLSLIDDNAPTETWTLRCSAVRRDSYGAPIDGYAKFTAVGSVSGIILDGYGSPVVWQSDSTIRNNGILRMAINEGSTAFDVGDTFIIEVASGVLSAGDNLIAIYIATDDINDPELFTDMESVTAKHGLPSTANTLSVGAQLAFTNGTPGVLCCQAAPSVPRRIWYRVVESASGGTTVDDCKFVLPTGIRPDSNSDIKFLVINTVTGTETQILPNKVAFYDPAITADPDTFITTGHPYSYTVVLETFVKHQGEDLVIVPVAGGGPTYYADVTSASANFDLSDVSGTISMYIYDATHSANNGTFAVVSVSGHALRISKTGAAFVAETGVRFRETDSSQASSAYILFTQDLALQALQGLETGVISIKDATFFDSNWTYAFEKLEAFELDILVPLPTQTKSAVIGAALQHCLNMSRIKNRKERILFTGAIQGLTPNNVTGVTPANPDVIEVLEGIDGEDAAELLADNLEDLTNYSVPDAFGQTYRCVYHYPDQITINISGSNLFFDGMFMAAAHGGLLSATGNVAIPSTNKTIAGFNILRNRTYSTTVSENITKAGICLVEPVFGGGRIVWGKTTSQSGYVEEQEVSICFIRDRVAKSSRLACQGFVGQPITPSLPISIQVRINSMLLGFIAQGLITKYGSIMVKQDATDPTQINITFAVQPTYPCNFIYIKFQIGTI